MTEGTEYWPRVRAGWLLRQSIRETIVNWRGLLAVSLLPIAGYFLSGLANFIPFDSLPTEGAMRFVSMGGVLTLLLAIIVLMLLGPFSFWVGWSRVLLLGPHAVFRPIHFRLWGREFLTFLYAILIQILVTLIFLPLMVLGGVSLAGIASLGLLEWIASDLHTAYWSLMIAILSFMVMAAALWARWSFVFPAIAVDAPRGIRRAWRLSKGVGKPLFLVWAFWLGIMMLPAVLALPSQIEELERVASDTAPTGISLNLMWGGGLIAWLLFYPLMALMASALAIAYREKVGIPTGQSAA